MTPGEADAVLAGVAAAGDRPLDLADTALALAAAERLAAGAAEVAVDGYRRHLRALVDGVTAAVADGLDPPTALADTLAGGFGYVGDARTYDALDNADLMTVIDRRMGLPVALGILYLHAARGQEWQAAGLNFPSHFVIRVAAAGGSWILDPFHGGQMLDDGQLQDLLNRVGAGPLLLPAHLAPVPDRGILLRLQNNIKIRRLHSGDHAGTLAVLSRMRRMDPQDPGLVHETAALLVRRGEIAAAGELLRGYLATGAGSPGARQTLSALLRAVESGRG